MMNNDRGIIKWLPFQSLVPNKEIIKSLKEEKNIIEKPLLSKEQQMDIENKLIEAFYEQINITLDYYLNGHIKTIKSKIINIDYVYKKITFEHNLTLLFSQIIKISL